MKREAFLCIFFFIAQLFCNYFFAQESQIQFQHLSVADGLSDNNVTSFAQDKYGFIWIGTLDGLNRYDGYRVEIFTHESKNSSSLSSDNINCLYTDSKDNLWIGTDNGLSKFNFNNHSFYNFKHDPANLNSLPSNLIRKITEDKNGLLWIATNQGLCCFDVNKKKFLNFVPQANGNSVSSKNIKDIARDAEGNIWISTANGLNKLNPSTLLFRSSFPKLNNITSANSMGKIAVDRENKLWISIDNQVNYFNPASDKNEGVFNLNPKPYGHSSLYLRDILVDASLEVWIAAAPIGCGYWMSGSDSFRFIKYDPFLNSSILSNAVRSLFQDRDGIIYMGSDKGVDRFNPSVRKFNLWRSFDPVSPRKWVRAFCEDNDKRLWVATLNGIFIFDRVRNTVISYSNIPNNATSLIENSVRSICLDKNGIMWVGTANGLARFDEHTNTFKTYLRENTNNTLPGNFIWSIITDHAGNLWVATNYGLCRYNYETDDFINFTGDSSKAIMNGPVTSIYEDADYNLWLSTLSATGSLIRYTPSIGKLTSWKYSEEESASVGGNIVYSITQGTDGVMWFGTSGGLSRYNKSGNSFTTFTTKDGLPNNHVAQLLFDHKKNLWMATDNGLCVMDSTQKHFKKFDVGDGLQGKEFNLQSGYITYDGYFCFAGYDGFNMFKPDSIRLNLKPPPIIIRSVKIFDEYLNQDSLIFSNKPLHVSYAQNFFTFEFAALNYDHPEKNQYACQLEGFDKKKIFLGKSRTISYTNVPPGNYTLKVMASNNDGVWNYKGLSWKVIISPPFWRTWWFYFLLIGALFFSLYTLYKSRINKILAIEKMRSSIARDLHDDVGSTLSSIRMVSALARKKLRSDPAKTEELLEKITESSERMTGNMQDIVWAVNPEHDNFESMISRMQEFAAQSFESKNIELFFSADEKIKSLKIPLTHRRDLFMIYKEAINNLSKYSCAKHGWITLSKDHDIFCLTIKDDGNGFEENNTRPGNGFRNMRERTKKIKGKISISSVRGVGTEVILEFNT